MDLAGEEPERLPCLQRLLDLGADVNAADKNGERWLRGSEVLPEDPVQFPAPIWQVTTVFNRIVPGNLMTSLSTQTYIMQTKHSYVK